MVYNYPYSGKSLEECTQLLREDSTSGSYSIQTLAYALESLRDSPEDIRQYLEIMIGISKETLQRELDKGSEKGLAAKMVESGATSISDVARGLAINHLKHVIGMYPTGEIHEKWNAAIPDLNASSGI